MKRLLELTLFELVDALRRGDISREDVVDAYLSRIKEVDSKLHAYLAVNEEMRSNSSNESLLFNAPIAIKDNISTRGLPTTCASKILEGYIPPYDATTVVRIKAEGGLIVGKTNMDEFAMGSSTENSAYGPTYNPWNLECVPGGSSGGSAAAVAAREAVASLGSDTGGSVRCPAAFCGVVGVKPTYGLVSRYGLVAYANSLEQIGPITRDVRDAALLLSVICGRDPHDSTSVDPPSKEYLSALMVDVKGLKAGIPKEFFGEGTDPRVAEAVWRAIKLLESHGMEYEEVSFPHLPYSLPAYYIIAMSEASSNLARYDGVRYGFSTFEEGEEWVKVFSKTRALGFGAEVKRRIILGTFALSAGYYDQYYLKALKVRTLIKGDFDRAFKKFDVLLAPTMPLPAFKIGERIEDPLAMYMVDIDTVPINLAGIPAISVPCGFVDGLPVGLQIMAAPFHEHVMFRVAYTYEQCSGYHNLKPPI